MVVAASALETSSTVSNKLARYQYVPPTAISLCLQLVGVDSAKFPQISMLLTGVVRKHHGDFHLLRKHQYHGLDFEGRRGTQGGGCE